MYKEIYKLDSMLSAACIPHTFNRFSFVAEGFQIRLYSEQECINELDDCVCHSGSHGHERGLLETYHLNNCNGYETAEEVFKGWLEMYCKANYMKKFEIPDR